MDAHSPRSAGALTRVRGGLGGLGPGEFRVAMTILANAEELVEWSTSDLATAASTSPATVSRACQTLGFRGFQHLRLEVARSGPADPLATPSGDAPLDATQAFFDDAAEAVRLTRDHLDVEALEAAAEALSGAARVLFVGSGFSMPPLQDAAMRLSTIGRAVEAPIDVLAQQFAARSLGSGDVCLALSYSGANAHSLAACRAARESGATVIAVTSFVRSPLTRLASITVATSSVRRAHDVDPFLTRLGQQLVLGALHDRVLRQRDGSALPEMRTVVAEVLVDDVPAEERRPGGFDTPPLRSGPQPPARSAG